jgi:transcriptional regulator with XRE-family HTH domain
MKLGEIVKEYRLKRGLTQGEVARLSHLTPGFISRLEKGEYEFTSPDTLTKLARALKIRVEILYDASFSRNSVIKEAPARSLHDSLRELELNLIEVPIVAELHMPGEIKEYIYLPRERTGKINYVGVKAKGSCLEPDIHDGDILIIDKDAQPETGSTVLCYHNSHEHPCLIKMKKKSDLADCEIYGVILWIMKKP